MTSSTAKSTEMPKAYDHHLVESRLYQMWMERGYFTPKIDREKEPFVIIMPPPNVTGALHIGQAMAAILEDVLIRCHRMRGAPTLWLPGRDHAGIAAQVVVERLLATEGLTRHDLGRERFLERMWQWMNEYGHIIDEQHKRLGASCDWSRERFTLDPGPSRAVRTTFVNLYREGLIYQGERIINWCPRCATVLSDLEVEHRETASHLYYVRYPLDGGDFITVATTRPETILGDTAVAVNPNDERFRGLVGRQAILPILERRIPIIADEAVDPAFGTGAVKITPFHDPVDFEVAQRHGLPQINILNPDATMNKEAGPYVDLDRFACRQAILEDLERQGLLVKVEPYQHAVGHCFRCGTVVEPMVSKQWFVSVKPLAEPAITAVTEGHITIVPERFTKVYLEWMENIRDWCISRQLWWGHRIPVWYCSDCGELTVAINDPQACQHCGSARIEQEPDVLDTWFSSGLWPHSTLGWPDDTEDLRYFYPTTVLETAYDILFFWVARMIMMGLKNMGQIPFRYVYLHGLIRDEKGNKMSKSWGNVINPLEAVNQYGADALRFALCTGSTPGNDMKLGAHRLEAGRNFANKLWNASRFVIKEIDAAPELKPNLPQSVEDRWILSRLHRLIANVNRLLSDFQLGEAGRQIHDFFWGEFCDWYIEMAKIRLRQDSEDNPLPILVNVLDASLRLLHPYMPFITEEIWQELGQRLPSARPESIMIAPYPQADELSCDEAAEAEMTIVIEVVRSIRNLRAEHKVEASRWVEAYVVPQDQNLHLALEGHRRPIEVLARARPLFIQLGDASIPPEKTVTSVLPEVKVLLPLAALIDLEAERGRLQRQLGDVQMEIESLKKKLADPQFRSRAPQEVVLMQEARLQAAHHKRDGLRLSLEELNDAP